MRYGADASSFSNSQQVTIPTHKYHLATEVNNRVMKGANFGPGETGITSAFSTFPGAYTQWNNCDSFDSDVTPRPPFTPPHPAKANWYYGCSSANNCAEGNKYNEGEFAAHSARTNGYSEIGFATHSTEANQYNDGDFTAHSTKGNQYNEGALDVHSTKANWYNELDFTPHSANVMLYNEGQSTMNVAARPRNNEGWSTTKLRRRANSSVSTISMSNVPEYMSAGQLLSPGGLSATSRLFDQAHFSDSAKAYALRGEEINVGLGLHNVNVLDGLVECDDIYEFAHSEECGGIPVTLPMKGGKKRRRDGTDIDGDFVAIDRYHLEDEDESSSEEDDNEGIAQGGALLEAPSPFPDFDEMKAALLAAAGETFYTMPTGPTQPGTLEYVQQVSRRCC